MKWSLGPTRTWFPDSSGSSSRLSRGMLFVHFRTIEHIIFDISPQCMSRSDRSKMFRSPISRSKILPFLLAFLCFFSTLSASAADAMKEGMALYKKAEYKQAIQKFSAMMKTLQGNDPRVATLYYYMGCCYYQLKMHSSAYSMFQLVAVKYPNSTEAPLARQMLNRRSSHKNGAKQPAGTNRSQADTTDSTTAPAQLTAEDHQSDSELDALPNENRFFLQRTTTDT